LILYNTKRLIAAQVSSWLLICSLLPMRKKFRLPGSEQFTRKKGRF
jgi:hypothetical protein